MSHGYIYLIRFESHSRNDVVKVGRTSWWRSRISVLTGEYRTRYGEPAAIADLFIKEVGNSKREESILIEQAASKFKTKRTPNQRHCEWMESGTIRKVRNLGRKKGMNQCIKEKWGLSRVRWVLPGSS